MLGLFDVAGTTYAVGDRTTVGAPKIGLHVFGIIGGCVASLVIIVVICILCKVKGM